MRCWRRVARDGVEDGEGVWEVKGLGVEGVGGWWGDSMLWDFGGGGCGGGVIIVPRVGELESGCDMCVSRETSKGLIECLEELKMPKEQSRSRSDSRTYDPLAKMLPAAECSRPLWCWAVVF